MNMLADKDLFENISKNMFNPSCPHMSDMSNMTLKQLGIIKNNERYRKLFSQPLAYTSNPNKIFQDEFILYFIDLDIYVMLNRLDDTFVDDNVIVFSTSFTLDIHAGAEMLLNIASILSKKYKFTYQDRHLSVNCIKLPVINMIVRGIKDLL